MPKSLCLLVCGLLLMLAPGCSGGRSYTLVETKVKPRHFKFVPVVEKTELGAGGWQAACLYLHITNDPGPEFICKLGIAMPMETDEAGPISAARAQRVAAACASEAADIAFGPTTAETPPGIACSLFIKTYDGILWKALKGSRVTLKCRPEAEAAAVH